MAAEWLMRVRITDRGGGCCGSAVVDGFWYARNGKIEAFAALMM